MRTEWSRLVGITDVCLAWGRLRLKQRSANAAHFIPRSGYHTIIIHSPSANHHHNLKQDAIIRTNTYPNSLTYLLLYLFSHFVSSQVEISFIVSHPQIVISVSVTITAGCGVSIVAWKHPKSPSPSWNVCHKAVAKNSMETFGYRREREKGLL